MLCFIWQDKESRAQPHGYVLLRQGGGGSIKTNLYQIILYIKHYSKTIQNFKV